MELAFILGVSVLGLLFAVYLIRSGRLCIAGLNSGNVEATATATVRIDVTAESGAVARTVLRLSRGAAQDANTRLSRLQLVGAQL